MSKKSTQVGRLASVSLVPNIGFVFICIAFLTSCGLRQNYASVRPKLELQGSGNIVVAGFDNRPYVVNQDKDPSFVGLMRSGYGIPYDVHTSNDEPFAGELAKAACGALQESGFNCKTLLLSRNGIQSQLNQALDSSQSKQALVFTVRDWKTDTYNGTSLKYHVALRVTNRSGKLLASSEVHGVDNLGSSWLNPAGIAEKETPKKMKEKLEALMNKQPVRMALLKAQ